MVNEEEESEGVMSDIENEYKIDSSVGQMSNSRKENPETETISEDNFDLSKIPSRNEGESPQIYEEEK